MARYKWQSNYDEENGWYVMRLIYMNPPEENSARFETEEGADQYADKLNKLEEKAKSL